MPTSYIPERDILLELLRPDPNPVMLRHTVSRGASSPLLDNGKVYCKPEGGIFDPEKYMPGPLLFVSPEEQIAREAEDVGHGWRTNEPRRPEQKHARAKNRTKSL